MDSKYLITLYITLSTGSEFTFSKWRSVNLLQSSNCETISTDFSVSVTLVTIL